MYVALELLNLKNNEVLTFLTQFVKRLNSLVLIRFLFAVKAINK